MAAGGAETPAAADALDRLLAGSRRTTQRLRGVTLAGAKIRVGRGRLTVSRGPRPGREMPPDPPPSGPTGTGRRDLLADPRLGRARRLRLESRAAAGEKDAGK